MSDFTGPLTMTELLGDHGRYWRLESPITYELGSLGSGKKITAEIGFITDGATVPRFLWCFVPPWGDHSRAAVIHDRLLTWIAAGTPSPYAITRHQADKIFLEALKVSRVNFFLRWAMYIGVSIPTLFGKKPKPPINM